MLTSTLGFLAVSMTISISDLGLRFLTEDVAKDLTCSCAAKAVLREGRLPAEALSPFGALLLSLPADSDAVEDLPDFAGEADVDARG